MYMKNNDSNYGNYCWELCIYKDSTAGELFHQIVPIDWVNCPYIPDSILVYVELIPC